MSDRYDKAHAAWVASCGDVLVSKICHQNLLEKNAAVDEMIANGEWKLQRGINFGITQFTHETVSRVHEQSEMAPRKPARKNTPKPARRVSNSVDIGEGPQLGLIFG